uniref:Beta-xylanase n=1 Tax=uncultured bacterium contig00193 TaxID=1181606 RepID=A0A806JZB6_9BACT|nr:endo-1,4-beta-xylanase A precursor [uncultured bacterium contig00193]
MKTKFIVLLLLTSLLIFNCDPPIEPVKLTIGDKKDLAALLPAALAGQSLNWTSSAPEIVSVTDQGVVTALAYTEKGIDWFRDGPATGTAVITVRTADGKNEIKVTVIATTEAQTDILALPPLKDQFAEHFKLFGNIFNPVDVTGRGESAAINNERLTRHFNILTPENHMKPSSLTSRRGAYSFDTADNMVNAAAAAGIKIHGHALLWHSQIPQWHRSMAQESRETALAAMKEYLTDVVGHFAGKIYSWDILNEVFPDGSSASGDWKTSMRSTGDSQGPNPWFVAIGSDFVYEAYLAARLADPNAVLYYNDYNTDQVGKATMIRDMVRDVNARYKQAYPSQTRLLIEGIGMQEHHNTGVAAFAIENTINLFRPLGVKISVAELDILGQGWGQFSPVGSGTGKTASSTVLNSGLIEQAMKYNEYMKVYIKNADIIERVSLWGVTDNRSWRSAGLPLLFDVHGKAKPAYYYFIKALE